jgi:nucleoside-diphosphate-sugar epimerase
MSNPLPRLPPTTSTIAILGAGGYIGSSLCRFFHALPVHKVVAVSRREPNHHSYSDYVATDVFADDWSSRLAAQGSLIVINCAFDFANVGQDGFEQKYAIFDRNLGAICRQFKSRLINISTTSAFPGCPSEYGQEKLFVEELFRHHGGINIRPGLISSWQHPGSAFLNLMTIVRRSKFVPLISARGAGFPICDLEALIHGIYLLTTITLNKSHTLSFYYRKRLPLGEILRIIENRLGFSRIMVPVPWRLAYILLLVREGIFGAAKVRADSVLDYARPVRRTFGRGPFARMIGCFRTDLEVISGSADDGAGFYFLEPTANRAVCRATNVAADIVGALRRLSDLQ